MARIAGVDLPNEKRIEIALTYIYGIGLSTSQRILKEKHGVKKIDISGWKKEQAALRQKEEERAAQYKPLREKLDQMLNVKYCVDIAKNTKEPQQYERKRDVPTK